MKIAVIIEHEELLEKKEKIVKLIPDNVEIVVRYTHNKLIPIEDKEGLLNYLSDFVDEE